MLTVGIVLIVLLLIRRRKDDEPEDESDEPNEPEDEDSDEAASDASASEAETDPSSLFIPLGAELPEDDVSDELELVDAVSADEVDRLMTDKAAEHFLESATEGSGAGKMGIINVGQLSEAYDPGATVDLADLQAKGLVADNIGRLKVLAAGRLDKALIVKADAFSMQAIKMITLTGGHAQKLGDTPAVEKAEPADDMPNEDALPEEDDIPETDDNAQ